MAEYITAACGYRNALSSRKLSKIIGRDRASVTRLKNNLKMHLPADISLMSEDALQEDDLDDESSSSEEDEPNADDDSDDELIEINDEGLEVLE